MTHPDATDDAALESAFSSTPEVVTPRIDVDGLVEDHADAMYRYALQYVRDEEIARDLVQETLLTAIECKENFEGRSAVRSWLIGILRHKALNSIKKRTRESSIKVEAVERDTLEGCFDEIDHWRDETAPAEWAADPGSVLQQKQFFTVLHQCLEKFPEKLRRLFLLREVDGLSGEELCSEFELTSSNVRVILHRVRLGLQQCLQANWFNNPALKGEGS